MKRLHGTALSLLVMIATSCSSLHKTPKTELTNGFYLQKKDAKKQVVYITIEDDVVHIRPVLNDISLYKIDTTTPGMLYPREKPDGGKQKASFNQYSFDIDILTIPLKFRPALKGVPLQLNTNLNGAVYFGYRTDRYNVRYATNPLNKLQRIINHYGFSMGGFTGIGNTALTPTTTGNAIAIEYDGVVWTKGITGILAINNFTVGIAIGFDNLLDKNRTTWIYETKPWFGLAFGLNLN